MFRLTEEQDALEERQKRVIQKGDVPFWILSYLYFVILPSSAQFQQQRSSAGLRLALLSVTDHPPIQDSRFKGDL